MKKIEKLLPKSLPFETKSGKIEFNEKNLEILDDYKREIIEVFREAGYFDFVNKFVNDEADLLRELAKETKDYFVPVVLGIGALGILSLIQSTEIAGFNMIAEDAANAIIVELRSAIFSNADYIKTLEGGISKLNNRLGHYAGTYATTTRTVFEQKAIDLAAQEAKKDLYWIYLGPNDEKTRPQCVMGLAKEMFTLLEKNDFQAQNLRWNCRHIFEPVSEKRYNKFKGFDKKR